jgi:hypothetical protein
MIKVVLVCSLFFTLLMVSPVSATGEQTLRGYVSCSKCKASKGASESHLDCMHECLAKGADVVLITDNDHSLIRLDNPNMVSAQHAHHVALYGYMNGTAFHVISVRIQ